MPSTCGAWRGRRRAGAPAHRGSRSHPVPAGVRSALCSRISTGSASRADAGSDPLLRQSDEPAAYERALEQLRRTAHVYACDCSRKDIGGEHYTGRCRTRGLEERPGRGLRVAIAPGVERFDDLLARSAGAGAGGSVRRPAAARSRWPLDVPVRGHGGRLPAARQPRDPGRRPAVVDAAARSAWRACSGAATPPLLPPSSAGGEASQARS